MKGPETSPHKIVERYQKGNMVAYLKRQEDGRFTINVGSVFDSGYDNWFTTEATTEEWAREEFDKFKHIWFNEMIPPQRKFEALASEDIYHLDPSKLDEGVEYY